jgi:hypothetical protein
MKTHIDLVGAPLCRPRSSSMTVAAADCKQCLARLDTLLGLCLRAVATARPGDRRKARKYATRLGIDVDALAE